MSSEQPLADQISQPANGLEKPPVIAPPAAQQHPPLWLHPTSLVFEIISKINRYIIPAGFALFGAVQGSTVWFVIACMAFFPSIIASVIHFLTLRYHVAAGELIVSEGLLFRRVRTVPVERIQNVDLVQNILHRLLRVAEVRIETASGTEPEAILRVLSLGHVEQLRHEIFFEKQAEHESQVDIGSPTTEGDVQPGTRSSKPGTRILEIPAGLLVKAGMASNRGLIVVGLIVGMFYQFDGFERINFNWIRQHIPANGGPWVIVGTVLIVIAILVLLRLLGIVWYLLRFYDYRLELVGSDLRIQCGLLTKVSASVPRKRVQFISIHRPLIMRLWGLATIRIETAGGAGAENENATTSISRSWFVPVVPESRVAEIVAVLRPDLQWDESQMDWQPVSPFARRRLTIMYFLVAILIGVVGVIVTRPWGWVGGALLLPLAIYWAGKKSRAMRYCRFENGVVYRSGILIRKTSVTFFEKMQSLRLDQTPFDRRWEMATLSVDTAASGPAEHNISVPLLTEAFAQAEYEAIKQLAAEHQPSFG